MPSEYTAYTFVELYMATDVLATHTYVHIASEQASVFMEYIDNISQLARYAGCYACSLK